MNCTNERCYCYDYKSKNNCLKSVLASGCPDFMPEEKLPCGNKQCGSHTKDHPDHCAHGFSDFNKFTCKDYIEEATERMIRIQDCR